MASAPPTPAKAGIRLQDIPWWRTPYLTGDAETEPAFAGVVVSEPVNGYGRNDERKNSPMIGLSVAIGRFVQALFWGILRVAGTVTAAVFAGALVLAVVVLLVRRRWRGR